MEIFTIVLEEDQNKYKVTKICFDNEGGFYLLVPYHSARKGFLSKNIYDISNRNLLPNREYETEYTADKVKLSFHKSGFIQFSSGAGNNIISGMDESGKAKGLGIKISPLIKVIKTGPTFAMAVWGLNEFKKFAKEKKGDTLIEFNDEDYCYRDASKEDWNRYLIEGFLHEAVHYSNNNLIKNGAKVFIERREFLYEVPGTIFKHRVLPFGKYGYFITLIVSRTKVSFGSQSGFGLNSPQGIIDRYTGVSLYATYPPPMSNLPEKSLNYVPKKQNE